MLTYPNFNPIALQLGSIKIYWYGIMYLISFVGIWWLANYRARIKKLASGWNTEEIEDLILSCMIGVIVGGRLGEFLFYQTATIWHNPLAILQIWRGGMSFHGGLIGVLIACFIFARKNKKSFFTIADFIAPLIPIGLGLGRLGNFINGELWGRVTDVPWAMVFPAADAMPRHPSQLYEFLLEGVALFLILWFYAAKKRPKMAVSGMFLLLYGIFRFAIEFVRVPDAIVYGWLTMGQLLCVPMIVIGVGLVIISQGGKLKNEGMKE